MYMVSLICNIKIIAKKENIEEVKRKMAASLNPPNPFGVLEVIKKVGILLNLRFYKQEFSYSSLQWLWEK